MAYLTDSEISTYCKVPIVSMQDVELASAIIDSYKSRSFGVEEYTEKVSLRKKTGYYVPEFIRKKTGYYVPEFIGKLLHTPRIEISNIKTECITPLGLVPFEYSTDNISFDDDTSLYFTFIPSVGATIIPFLPPVPKYLRITYTAGYATIPDRLKYICGTIADSICKNGGFNNYDSRTDLNMSIKFSSQGILTNELKALIDGIVLT